MTRGQLEAEKIHLQRKLKVRERAGDGYTANIEAIKQRIAAIDTELAALGEE